LVVHVCMAGQKTWEVVGGADKGGIIVRQSADLKSDQLPDRLSTGAIVDEIELLGDRLRFRRRTGSGPDSGWVSVKLKDKELLVRTTWPVANLVGEAVSGEGPSGRDQIVVGPGSGYTHRWAVNIGEWDPVGGLHGPEFQFLLGLIAEEGERAAIPKFRNFDDQKRALMSRLLIRQAAASSLGRQNFDGIAVKRTKGKKPFVERPLMPESEAPNWNVNVSHEGDWVVLASDTQCVIGIDVAELRRVLPSGREVDFYKSFKDQLTENEWKVVRAGGETLDEQYSEFARFWSAKEAFTKARGDGIAFEVGRVEFAWRPLAEYPLGDAYIGTAALDGVPAPLWRLYQHKLPCETTFWVTVARGPQTDIVDAFGEFSNTFRKSQNSFTASAWDEALGAPSPDFHILPVGSLVPVDQLQAYVEAGGMRP